MQLLNSQQSILHNIVQTVNKGSSFVVVNGEPGVGKSTITEYLTSTLISNDFAVSFFQCNPSSKVEDLRSDIIKNLFEVDEFDSNDRLLDICQLYEISNERSVVLIDSLDYFDRNFLDEIQQFFIEYSSSINLSIIITTSHLLTHLLIDSVQPFVYELTLRQLNQDEKRELIKYYIQRRLSVTITNQLVDSIAPNCGNIPAQIVSYLENFNMSDTNINKENNEKIEKNENLSSPNSIVPDSDEAPVIIRHTVVKPKGPNKFVVISIAVVLAILLIAIVALLLKKQNIETGSQEEVIVYSQETNTGTSVETLIENANINQHENSDEDDNKLIDDLAVTINEQESDLQLKDETSNNVEPNDIKENQVANNIDSVEETVKVVVEDSKESEKQLENSKKIDEKIEVVVEQNTDALKEDIKNQDNKQIIDKKDTIVQNKQVDNEISKKQNDVKKEEKEVVKNTSNKVDVQKQNEVKNNDKNTSNKDDKQKQNVKPKEKTETLKVGEVKSFAEINKSTNIGNTSTTSRNYVVQVACSANKSDLEAKAKNLGSNAFIYERKNNKLNFVLVVGYYANQKEAQSAAKKIGGGAFPKSIATVNNEKK